MLNSEELEELRRALGLRGHDIGAEVMWAGNYALVVDGQTMWPGEARALLEGKLSLGEIRARWANLDPRSSPVQS